MPVSSSLRPSNPRLQRYCAQCSRFVTRELSLFPMGSGDLALSAIVMRAALPILDLGAERGGRVKYQGFLSSGGAARCMRGSTGLRDSLAFGP